MKTSGSGVLQVPSSFKAKSIARLVAAAISPVLPVLGVGALMIATPMAWADGGAGGGGALGGSGFNGAAGSAAANPADGGGGGASGGLVAGDGGASGTSVGGTGGTAISQNGQNGAWTGSPADGGGGGGGGAHGITSVLPMNNAGNLTGGSGGWGGSVYGSSANASAAGGGGGAGGYGAVLVGAGDANSNSGAIAGGEGGRGGEGFANSSNAGSTAQAGLAGTGGDGGVGILTMGKASTLDNALGGSIAGGRGGDSYANSSMYDYTASASAVKLEARANSGAGGVALQVMGDGSVVTNAGNIRGGDSGSADASVSAQGSAAPGYTSSAISIARSAAGGAGIVLNGANSSIANTATGTIAGGDGNAAVTSGTFYLTDTNGNAAGTSGSNRAVIGGRGGDGVRAEGTGANLINAGAIGGGTGGQAILQIQGNTIGGVGSVSSMLATSGNGGDGAHFSAAATVENSGRISGGAAGDLQVNSYSYGNNSSNGAGSADRTIAAGNGGNGVYLADGKLGNEVGGVIVGGAAAFNARSYVYTDGNTGTETAVNSGGAAGAGVTQLGGSLTNAGAIEGGSAAQQVEFYNGPSGNGTRLVSGSTISQNLSRVTSGAVGGIGLHVGSTSVVNEAGATISGGAASGYNYAYGDGLYLYNTGGAVTGIQWVGTQTSVSVAGQGGAGLVMDGNGAVQNAGAIRGGGAGLANNQNTAYAYADMSSGGYGLYDVQGTVDLTSTSTSTGFAGGVGVSLSAGSLVNQASGSITGGAVTDGATLASYDRAYAYAGLGSATSLVQVGSVVTTARGGAGGDGAVVSGNGVLRNDGVIAGGSSAARFEGNSQVVAYIENSGSNNTSNSSLRSTITGGAGGDGVRASGTASIANTGVVSGGNSANVVQRQAYVQLDEYFGYSGTGNTATATGTVSITGGAGGAGASLSDAATLSNSGTVQGGNSLDNFSLSMVSWNNNGATTSGSMAVALQGGAGGAGVSVTGGALTNSGTVTGGNGGSVDLASTNTQDNVGGTLSLSANAGAGGAGVRFTGTSGASVYNQAGGTLQGGDGGTVTNVVSGNVPATGLAPGAGGAGVEGANATVTNAGTIRGGLGGDGVRADAINFTGGVNKLTIEATSNIVGSVQAFSRADTFGLGGATDASFDVAQLGDTAQYRGFGELEKTGASKWTLTGASNEVIAFAVREGRLANNALLPNTPFTVASGGTLAGNGTVGGIAAQSGSIVAPGNSIGTLTVNGNYSAAAGSIYQVEYDGTTSDRINASGTATIAAGAGLQAVHFGTAPVPLNVRYTVVTAAGGVTGRYTLSGETMASPFVTLHDTYDANNVYLEAEQTAPLVPGAPGVPALAALAGGYTINQVGTGLAAQSLAVTSALRQSLIYQPTVGAARAAFDQLSGEVHASAKTALLEDSRFVRDAANDRLLGAWCAPGAGAMATTAPAGAAACAPATGHVAWGKVFGSTGRFKGDGNAQKLERDIGGFLVGADTPVGGGWRVGGLAGYSRSTMDKARESSIKTDDYTLGAYGGNQWGDTSLRLGASHTWHKLDTQRSVAFTGFADSLHAKYDAGTSQVFGELGQRFNLGTVALEPFAGLAYVRVKSDAFSERGGLSALHGSGDAIDATFGTLGVRASTQVSESTRLHGMAGWRHSFSGVVGSSNNAFAGGSPFTVYGIPLARNVAVVEAGVETQLRPDVTLGASYSGQFGSGLKDHGFKVSLGMKF